MSLRAASFALAILLCAAPAAGQQDETGAAADISGTWTFKTAPYHMVCTMNGQLALQPTAEPDVYEGRLVAYETCAGGQRYEAQQSSIVVRAEDRLTVTSTLELVLPSPEFYLPDDFELRIVNGALMVGDLISGNIRAKAEFRRGEGLVS